MHLNRCRKQIFFTAEIWPHEFPISVSCTPVWASYIWKGMITHDQTTFFFFDTKWTRELLKMEGKREAIHTVNMICLVNGLSGKIK